MANLSVFNFESSEVRFKNCNGKVWVCLTDMAKASGKLIGNWNKTESTKEFLVELESVMGFVITETIQGGIPEKQGTWAIEEVAIEFAGWCSVKFKIWMIQQIKTLMTQGYVALPQPQQPQLPQTYLEALKALVVSEEEKLLLQSQNQQLQAKVEQDAPLVSYAEAVRFSDDSVDFNTYAKLVNTGRTRLFRQMRECGVIMKNSTLPYQRFVDAGYFEVSQEIDSENGKLIPFALVTGKGQIWLKQRLDEFARIEQSVLKSFAQLAVF